MKRLILLLALGLFAVGMAGSPEFPILTTISGVGGATTIRDTTLHDTMAVLERYGNGIVPAKRQYFTVGITGLDTSFGDDTLILVMQGSANKHGTYTTIDSQIIVLPTSLNDTTVQMPRVLYLDSTANNMQYLNWYRWKVVHWYEISDTAGIVGNIYPWQVQVWLTNRF